MSVVVANLQNKVPIDPAAVRNAALKILQHEKIKDAELSVVFVPTRKMKALHKKYLDKDNTTDVLSFDFSTKLAKQPKRLVGEIVICADTALTQAKTFGTTTRYELYLYLVHGILHFLGYDDHRDHDIRKMRAKEKQLMRLFKI